MAESRQFGGGRVFGDKVFAKAQGATNDCALCEAMLADALDGKLTTEQQTNFDLHTASCAACGQIFADARRGAAWLEMLRYPAPEPPADLLERILAQTSVAGLHGMDAMAPVFIPGHAAQIASYAPNASADGAAYAAKVLPFPRRAVAAIRRNAFGQLLLQPRLAMTAAMAFFSIALTLNITGFHPTSLRASDITPGSLRRDVVSVNSNVVRYYESLRVVYELESRVHDLQSAQDSDAAGNAAQPEQAPAAQPANQPDEHKAQPPTRRPAPGAGSSRREVPGQPRRVTVSESHSMRRSMTPRYEGRQA